MKGSMRWLLVGAAMAALAGCGGGDDGGNAPSIGGGSSSNAALSGPASLTFPAQVVGTTSSTMAAVIRSVGSGPVVFNGVSVTGPFAVATNSCTGSLASGGECRIEFTFTPAGGGAAQGTATVRSNQASGDHHITLQGSGLQSSWVRGEYLPSSEFYARCPAPRSGVEPRTGFVYQDRPGTVLDERNWLRSWTHELYLWFNEVPDLDPGLATSTLAYFDQLKSPSRDRFHFTYPTDVWLALSEAGESAGYGATWVLLSTLPPREAVVAYTEPGSPAAAAGLVRGTRILRIDGVELVSDNTAHGVDVLNAGLFPETAGELHTFTVQDPGSVGTRTMTVVSTIVTAAPVQNTRWLDTPTGRVGYLLFNDHIATAESALVDAISSLKSDGITDLVLDLRYNGGGFLAIASQLSYMIAGQANTGGVTFEQLQFNSQHPQTNPVTGAPLDPMPFLSTTVGYSLPSGQALPTLDLDRVFVLTGSGTCSASESIINSLRGADVQVIQIGSRTCGKPYGFYPMDNCGTTYFSINFRGVNAKNFGDYPDGFAPFGSGGASVYTPGCPVADDFGHQLGDPAEARLKMALNYRATGSCALPPNGLAKAQAAPAEGTWLPPVAEGQVVKSPAQQNRIMSRP